MGGWVLIGTIVCRYVPCFVWHLWCGCFDCSHEEVYCVPKSYHRSAFSSDPSRSSSPVRLVRDENRESNIKGIYPLGEGAGYAGGITSAALDGLKTAIMISNFNK